MSVGGSHSRLNDVLSSLVVVIFDVRGGRRCVLSKDDVIADDGIVVVVVVVAKDATRSHDDARASVANSAAAAEGGIDPFIIDETVVDFKFALLRSRLVRAACLFPLYPTSKS